MTFAVSIELYDLVQWEAALYELLHAYWLIKTRTFCERFLFYPISFAGGACSETACNVQDELRLSYVILVIYFTFCVFFLILTEQHVPTHAWRGRGACFYSTQATFFWLIYSAALSECVELRVLSVCLH